MTASRIGSRPGAAALVMALAVLLVLGVMTGLSSPAEAKKKNKRFSNWAPVSRAVLTPGIQMVTRGGQGTANFVFTDRRNNVYIGYSAHCAGKGAATDTNGCRQSSHPLGTRVQFRTGGSLFSSGRQVATGRLTYSSWITMRRRNTSDQNACEYNDFALVKLRRKDRGKVNPSIPFFGGPNGIDRDGSRAGERLYSYGNSGLRGGTAELSPKYGTSLGSSGGGWTHTLYTATPGVPGDSGSAFLNANGRALGTLSTLGLLPLPGSNNIGDLRRELAFASRYSGISGLKLTKGTQRFSAAP